MCGCPFSVRFASTLDDLFVRNSRVRYGLHAMQIAASASLLPCEAVAFPLDEPKTASLRSDSLAALGLARGVPAALPYR